MSATEFSDPYLKAVQVRMIMLSDEFPAGRGKGFCSEEGLEVIRGYVRELRLRAEKATMTDHQALRLQEESGARHSTGADSKKQRPRLLRIACFGVLVLIFGYAFLCAFAEIHERVVRSRSEALYAEFLAIHPGVTAKTDTEQLLKRWAGRFSEQVRCEGDKCEYTVGDVWGYSRWWLLTRIARDHAPSSMLELETKGLYVLSTSFSARVMVPKGQGTREERPFLNDPNYVPYSSGDYALIGRATLSAVLPSIGEDVLPMRTKGYRAIRVNCMNCLDVRVSALPSVPAETRSQLFRFDFGCMTRWSICTDKEDLMPAAAREQAIETAANDELDEMERECAYTPAQLAAAANDAVELQLLNEPSVSGDVKVRVLRYIGGTNPLRQGDELTLNISRAYNRSAALEKARTLGNKLVVLYPGESYGFILPYDQCGLLPDDSFETVSRNFEVHP